MNTIPGGVVALGFDGAQVDVGVAKTEKRLETLANSAETAGTAAAAGIDKIGESGEKSAKKVDRSAADIIRQIQRTIATTEAGARGTAEYYKAIANQRGVDPATLDSWLKKLDEVNQKQRIAIATSASMDKSVQKLGMSEKQLAFAMRGLPAQFTDITVGLASGQKPLMVLLQQGGQIKDMFGGIGPAFQAMGTYIMGLVNPVTILATAIGALGVAYMAGASESDKLTKSLIANGGAAGTTADELSGLAEQYGKMYGNIGRARDAVQALAESGKVTSAVIPDALRAIVAQSELTGKAVKDLVVDFDEMGKDPTAAAKKLNDQYNFLTADIYKQIKALQDQGKEEEAVILLAKQYADVIEGRSGQITQNLGYIERAWAAIKDTAKGALDVAMDFGRATTLSKELAAEQENLARVMVDGSDAEIASAQRAVQAVKDKMAVDKVAAQAKADVIKKEKDAIKSIDDYQKYVQDSGRRTQAQALSDEAKAFGKAVSAFSKDSPEYAKALDSYNIAVKKINESFKDKGAEKAESAYSKLTAAIKSKIDAANLEIATSLNATEAQKLQIKFNNDLKTGALKLSEAQKKEAQSLLDTYTALEKTNLQKKFEDEYNRDQAKTLRDIATSYDIEAAAMGLSAQEAEKLTASKKRLASTEEETIKAQEKGLMTESMAEKMRKQAEAANALERQKIDEKYQRARDPYLGLKDSLIKYQDQAEKSGDAIGSSLTNAFNSAEDAWAEFVTSGKISFSSFANSIIADLARIQARAAIASAIGSSGSGWLGSIISGIGSIFGGASSGGASSFSLASEGVRFDAMLGTRALGGPVTAGQSYLVGENGPELFSPSVSGAVIPNDKTSSGMQITSSPVINIDSRTDQAQVRQLVIEGVKAGNRELADTLQRQGRI